MSGPSAKAADSPASRVLMNVATGTLRERHREFKLVRQSCIYMTGASARWPSTKAS